MPDQKITVLRVNSHRDCDRANWADLIVDGNKSIELRSWKTDFRGRLFIDYRDSIIGSVVLRDIRFARFEDAQAAAIGMFSGRDISSAIRIARFAWILEEPRRVTPYTVRYSCKNYLAGCGNEQMYTFEGD